MRLSVVQEFTVIVDTGSTMLAVPCQGCVTPDRQRPNVFNALSDQKPGRSEVGGAAPLHVLPCALGYCLHMDSGGDNITSRLINTRARHGNTARQQV